MKAPERARAPLLAEVREGLTVVFGNRMLRAIAGCTGTSNLWHTAIGALYILFTTRELGLAPAAIGLIFSASSGGGLMGAFVAGLLARRFGVGRVIVGSALLSGLAPLPIAFARPSFALPLLIAVGLLHSLSVPIYNINQVSLRQAITPRRLQGRMNATMRFVVWGTMPLGGLLGGALGQSLGLRTAIAVAAVGSLLAFLWVWRSPVFGLLRIPEPDADE